MGHQRPDRIGREKKPDRAGRQKPDLPDHS
jgi:hypothetical protein